MSIFAKRLRELRIEKEVSQEELGRFLKLSKSTISLYESDKREPDHETLSHLADYFNVSTDYLLGRSNIRHQPETLAAHRTDDPTQELPPEARKSLEEFQEYIIKKYGKK